MLQDSASPHSNDEKRAALADAAWALLATHDIDKIGLDMVADMADIEHGLAGALGGSVQRLVLAKMAALDQQSVMEVLTILKMLARHLSARKSSKACFTGLRPMPHIARRLIS